VGGFFPVLPGSIMVNTLGRFVGLVLFRPFVWCLVGLSFGLSFWGIAQAQQESNSKIFAKDNLVAWCIVPFDGKKRGPAERAAMCAKLGLKKIAYDWRNEHVATFEQEILEYKKHGLDYFAFWSTHDKAFQLFEKHGLHPQIWHMFSSPEGVEQEARVKAAAEGLLPLVERTRKMGSKLGLYNHGSWNGQPENMIAVCRYLREKHDAKHVGIVYNLHHAHDRINDFAHVVKILKPYLLCLNLNGMTRDGEKRGQKILPLGEGELDVVLLKTIRDSGYSGPIGIIGHTQDDVEQRLQDNLNGLKWIIPQLDGKPAGPKPKPRTWSPKIVASQSASVSATLLDGKAEYRKPPITVECRVTLTDKNRYNILVASDTKQSGAHWEIFSMNGSGKLTAYTPGFKPDHTSSEAMICDGKPHNIAMTLESERIRLFVDGKMVADQTVESLKRAVVPGKLGIAGLVEGGIGCSGPIDWIRISSGSRKALATGPAVPTSDPTTLLVWKRPASKAVSLKPSNAIPLEYSAQLVKDISIAAQSRGNPARGLVAFSAAKSACLSCHKLGKHGGTVGPDLTEIGKQRKPEEIIESILWPKRHVKPEYLTHVIVTDDGRSHRGYIIRETKDAVVLRDPTKGPKHEAAIPKTEIEFRREAGTLMPDNLAAALTATQLNDVLRLLIHQGKKTQMPLAQIDSVLHHTMAHMHGPAAFPIDRKPLHTEDWPSWNHYVNRDRIFDFYSKQADHFRNLAATGKTLPALLTGFPGLDGGELGHWGNQNDETWASDAWSKTDRGILLGGIFRVGKKTVPRGICIRLGDSKELACCFDPDTLTYVAAWKGGFVKTSSFRHGFLNGLLPDGALVEIPAATAPTGSFKFKGYYRVANRVLFEYRIGDTDYLDSPWIKDGKFERNVVKATPNVLGEFVNDSSKLKKRWPQQFQTEIKLGAASPYAVDKIELPFKNPWNALFFAGGHGFLPDGSALVCTMQGDVWKVTGFAYPSKTATWTRFASGLHHLQGMVIDLDGIFVLGRDQITRLHDYNDDGEADFHECFSTAYKTSAAGHDFICGLVRDKSGNFYTASGNQGIVRISPDGKRADIVATGFRNPDGIGITADGNITVPCSEGGWTPASMICEFRPDDKAVGANAPYFGFPGPKNGKIPRLPLAYLPRGVDNSAGGQTTVTSDRWGPLKDQLLHFSFGTGSHFLLLRDQVGRGLVDPIETDVQGAIVPLPGEFASGAHRGKFSPHDGQLYVCGMQGWGSYTPQTGSFERVRYTGDPVQLPIDFKVHSNGVLVRFSNPVDLEVAQETSNHFAQVWNYRYSQAYGSPEYSTKHQGMLGHDTLTISKVAVTDNGRSVFLEIPDIQPVNQLHLRIAVAKNTFRDLFVTVHKVHPKPLTSGPNLFVYEKVIQPHPILRDLAMATRSIPNPYRTAIKGARPITIETGTNLSYVTRTFNVKAGEPIALTLDNPDVVPHNLAIVKPGTLERVGSMANKLISDPDAAIRHYIPQSSDVLAFTDVVGPKSKFTIHFTAPETPGRYPYLCTFPGHWLIMNGEMVVEAKD
jgi:putative heme-binding domain-containing protein